MKLALFAIGLFALGCGSIDAGNAELIDTAPSALEEAGIIHYESGVGVPESELSPLNPADFGGTVEGDVEWSGRIDLLENGLIGGVFQATHGKHAVLYPGVLHATVHVGQVILTDEIGPHILGVGDSWLVTKGTYVEFEVKGPRFQASFLGNFNSEDAPGPVFVHQKGKGVPVSELGPFGEPADHGATVLKGDPEFSARIDYEQGSTFAGVYAATRGAYLLPNPPWNEHNTFITHGVLITNEDTGVTYHVKPGDSLLIKAGTPHSLASKTAQFQDSFLAVTQ
ncbi:hypothetical protein [Polyangium aurulentum]|uniref:hypothetical protein n=1 Tax=Polyangium aurulentum TaxID=2567896 RepID=UPI0010ADEBA2|nr:hypothetical protein [Polyangium aurulentum]UQA54769.1 hypothetical protein E8A73_025710 [Polyangium aurulentum]